MNKLVSRTLAIASSAVLFVSATAATTVLAASGKDVVETFESYRKGNKDMISSLIKGSGNFEGKISTDTQTSAPNRPTSKVKKGNFHSMKISFDSSKDGWGYVRVPAEDPYALSDLGKGVGAGETAHIKGNPKLTFYAKADRPVSIYAGVDIKDCPFMGQAKLTTKWQKFEFDIKTGLTPELGTLKTVNDYDKSGKWNEPYVGNFKFRFDHEFTLNDQLGIKHPDYNVGVTEATIWIDSICFEGEGITERTRDDEDYPLPTDRDGLMPSDFDPSRPEPPVIDNKPVTPSKPDANTNTKPGTTPSKPVDSQTASTVDPDVSEDTSSIEGLDSSESDLTSSEATESELTDETTGKKDKDKKSGLSTGAKVGIGVGVVVVILGGAAAAYYFLVYKKNKMQ